MKGVCAVWLFVDDLRDPPGEGWTVVRSSADAIDVLSGLSVLPDRISFDHDLGGSDTAMVVVDWIIEAVLDGKVLFPAGFDFVVHSANPVGAANILGKFGGFVKFVSSGGLGRSGFVSSSSLPRRPDTGFGVGF